MSGWNKRDRSTIEAVGRHVSATVEKGGANDACFVIGGPRIAVDLATIKRCGTDGVAAPRLRFDKVVVRLVEHLQSALEKAVPHGMTVAVTITAPIRLPAKTADAIEVKIRTRLKRKATRREAKETIHGNRVRIRFLKHALLRSAKLAVFVHNHDSDAPLLLNMTRGLIAALNADATRGAAGARIRWLIVRGGRASHLETYRQIYSQLHIETDLKKTFMVSNDGRVGLLADAFVPNSGGA